MWEAVVLLTAASASAFGSGVLRVATGLPLGFAILAVAWRLGWLPSTVYPWVAPSAHSPLVVAALATLTDAAQYGVHRLTHAARSESHAVHHAHRKPTSVDAFRTGAWDAALQLMLPILCVLWAVRPSRVETTAYGVLYGLWLQYIHSDHPRALKHRSRVWVTPAFHRRHHTHPQTNFGHVLRVWDDLGRTARD